jgi:DNA-binding NarL/FixJ family response regulator
MAVAPIPLGIIDDHEVFRTALGRALRDHGFKIVAEGADARATFPHIDSARPAAVILDLKLPNMDGLTALRELRARSPELKILVLTSSEKKQDLDAAWSAGADGYAIKTVPLHLLVDGLHRVLAGERFLQPGLAVGGDPAAGPLGPLSPRERDIFRLIVRGLTSAEIATQLCISIKTVTTHRDRVLKKLSLHSAVQLMRFAATHGLIET